MLQSERQIGAKIKKLAASADAAKDRVKKSKRQVSTASAASENACQLAVSAENKVQ